MKTFDYLGTYSKLEDALAAGELNMVEIDGVDCQHISDLLRSEVRVCWDPKLVNRSIFEPTKFEYFVVKYNGVTSIIRCAGSTVGVTICELFGDNMHENSYPNVCKPKLVFSTNRGSMEFQCPVRRRTCTMYPKDLFSYMT